MFSFDFLEKDQGIVSSLNFVDDFRDLEGRRMRIPQIYVCNLLYFLLKAAAFDVSS